MHLSPLTGIETISQLQMLISYKDASFTPYGDWNHLAILLCFDCRWCIFHPLRGLKRCCCCVCFIIFEDASFTPYGDWNIYSDIRFCQLFLMHLSPLTGIETAIAFVSLKLWFDASFTPYGDWNSWASSDFATSLAMHLSPLTGIETALKLIKWNLRVRCIFHPLRGLKLSILSRHMHVFHDASFTPYGDWNPPTVPVTPATAPMHLSPLTGIETNWLVIGDLVWIWCIFHPLRGLKQPIPYIRKRESNDASFTPYGDWNDPGWRKSLREADASFTPYGDWNAVYSMPPRAPYLMHLSPLTGIETLDENNIVSSNGMHLSPLTGIETASSASTVSLFTDASFTPYGDWNHKVSLRRFKHGRCIFHPLRGLKLFHLRKFQIRMRRCIFHPLRGLKLITSELLTSYKVMHLSPLTGIETLCHFLCCLIFHDASFTPYGDWNLRDTLRIPLQDRCIFHPLRGLKRISDLLNYRSRYRCIFHPLRGLKQLLRRVHRMHLIDASFTPYGDWNRSFSIRCTVELGCIFHPLRGLKLNLSINYFHYGKWCIFHPLRGLKPLATLIKEDNTQMHLSPLTGIETSWTRSSSPTHSMHLSPLTGIETL